MTDFDYDCLQKKRLAHMAIHRKNGSKSRQCRLATDHMTPKQWKERNGAIVSINLNEPTSWENFKALSKASQEEYLRSLSDTYGANSANLAEMFGVGAPVVRRYIQAAGLDIRFPVGRSMNSEQRAAWEHFLGCPASPLPSASAPAQPKEPELKIDTSMRMNRFSMRFSGDISIDMIANSLRRLLGENAAGEIEIVCDLSRTT